MELRVLKYFLMVAREENITKAAQLLHVTQPTLSRQLMQLEEELGVKLFHRGKHNVTLTEDGMLLRRRAQELVSLSEKTKLELQHKEEMPAGEIAIGCGETKSMSLLSQSMVSFRHMCAPIEENHIFIALRSSDFSGFFAFCGICSLHFVLCGTIDIPIVLRYNDNTKVKED